MYFGCTAPMYEDNPSAQARKKPITYVTFVKTSKIFFFKLCNSARLNASLQPATLKPFWFLVEGIWIYAVMMVGVCTWFLKKGGMDNFYTWCVDALLLVEEPYDFGRSQSLSQVTRVQTMKTLSPAHKHCISRILTLRDLFLVLPSR